jgi:hypothetical protein
MEKLAEDVVRFGLVENITDHWTFLNIPQLERQGAAIQSLEVTHRK